MYIFYNWENHNTIALESNHLKHINGLPGMSFDVIINIDETNILYNELIQYSFNWLLVSIDEVIDGDFYHISYKCDHTLDEFILTLSINIITDKSKHTDIIKQHRNNNLNKLLA